MADQSTNGPLQIKLDDEARKRLMVETQLLFSDEFELSLSDFQTERVLDFFVRHLGAPVYNQAIRDARTFLQEKLDDLDGEFYEPLITD